MTMENGQGEYASNIDPHLLKRQLWELEEAFNNSYNGISIVDKNGNIIRTNAAMMRLYQLDANNFVGKNIKNLVQDKTFSDDVSSKVITTGRPVTIIQEISTGKKCLTFGSPVFNENHEVEMVVVNSHDVTELYNLQEQLKRSQKLLDRYRLELSEYRVDKFTDEGIVVRSKKMLDVLDLTRRLAPVDTTVLILGESGVGKELIANILHKANVKRSSKPFIKINCGAIPRDLLESELFGYEPGAFTGASREGRRGIFELADGGSIFFDEISELPADLQVKLLRVLQEREFSRIGSSRVVRVDIRIIAGSNKDLYEMVSTGAFRQDLYYRLSVVPLFIPPLRERKEDILAIAQHYLVCFNQKYGFNKVLSPDVLELMESYSWPGNVRELINAVERMVVISENDILVPVDLFIAGKKGDNQSGGGASRRDDHGSLPQLRQVMAGVEREEIARTIRCLDFNAAAKALGLSRATLARKMRKYGITRRRQDS